MVASITWPGRGETQARRPAARRCAMGRKASAEATRISASLTRAAAAVGSISTQIRVMMVIRISESRIAEDLAVGATVFTSTTPNRVTTVGMGIIIMALLIIKVDTITVVVGEISVQTLISNIMGAMGIAAMGVMCIRIVGIRIVGIGVMEVMEIEDMVVGLEGMGVALSEAVVSIIISKVAVIEVGLIRIVIAGRSLEAPAISSRARRKAIAGQFSAAVVITTINSSRAAVAVGGMSMGSNNAVGRVVGHAVGHAAAEISTQARGVDAAGSKAETSSKKI
jgi:hypothetical protein